jgi:hypothetical protein
MSLDDKKFITLKAFLESSAERKSGNTNIVSKLGEWTNKKQYLEWRKPYVEKGVLASGRGKGGATELLSSLNLVPPVRSKRVTKAEEKMLDLIPLDGSTMGLNRLRTITKVGKKKFRKMLAALEDAGLAKVGRGQGGSVRRTPEGMTLDFTGRKGLVEDESKLYASFKNWLENNLKSLPHNAKDFTMVKITATPAGHKRNSGQWTRPDVTQVEVTSLQNLPVPNVEVTSYEIKRNRDAKNLVSVYEAAAHRRFSHSVYLVAEVKHSEEELPENIKNECATQKIGLMKMYKIENDYECSTDRESEAHIPPLTNVDDALDDFFSDGQGKDDYLKSINRTFTVVG